MIRAGIALLALATGAPVAAQMDMPGMPMPARPARVRSKPAPHEAHKPVPAKAAPMEHSAMPGMAMPAMQHAVPDAPVAAASTALAVGNAPAPPVPTDHYADRSFPAAEMAAARDAMMREEGGRTFHQVLVNLAEAQLRGGRAGYRWDGEGWIGGDRDRLVLKSEGEGDRDRVGAAEVQALFGRAVGPYFDLQAGVRQDLAPATRTYATLGFEGLAPYMFQVEGAAFLSTHGDLLARLEGWHDARLTQWLILQPRIELNFAAQDVAASRIGAGLSNAELGLRLRYEIAREFAPYVGISWDRRVGATARYARAAGDDASAPAFVAGVRFWF